MSALAGKDMSILVRHSLDVMGFSYLLQLTSLHAINLRLRITLSCKRTCQLRGCLQCVDENN